MDVSLRSNFRVLFLSQSIWKRKEILLKKIDGKLKNKVLDVLRQWYDTSIEIKHR
jgi:hypothetical protein